MKSQAELAEQAMIDHEILHYVREIQASAPVGDDAVHSFLKRYRSRRITEADCADRLGDLVSRGCLETRNEWVPGIGQCTFYTITHKGRQVLDGALPPNA